MKIIIILLVLFIVGIYSCGKENSIVETIPAKYDLRYWNLITPVRNQNGITYDGKSDMNTTVGLCWAFSSLSSLESNMLKQGITNNPYSPEASLSPWYLGNYVGFNQPYYEYNDDTIPGVQPPVTFGYYSFQSAGWGGGGGFWTGDYLISGKELPIWDDCPMPNSDQTARITLTPPFATVKKKYNIAQMSIIFAEDFPSVNDYRNHIKKYILKNGALQSFSHLEIIDIQGITKQIVNGIEYNDYRFMDKDNFNMYTYETNNLGTILLTHAITIAGWDDFREINVGGHRTTGAWLIKDSMGKTSWEDGYFWLAYDDAAINFVAFGLIACPEESFEHQSKYQTHSGILSNLYQNIQINDENSIDLGMYGYLLNGDTTCTSWGFAEFYLDTDETLSAVGIFSSNRNQLVTIQIFKDTIENKALFNKNFILTEVGYHIVNLKIDIQFRASETMIIGVGYNQSSDHKRLPLVYVQNNEYNFDYPTYFGKQVENDFQLTPYSEINTNAAFFMQAIVLKSKSEMALKTNIHK